MGLCTAMGFSAGRVRCTAPIISVFEENPHSLVHFDYGSAWQKHGGGEMMFVLNIDSIAYRCV